jgi:Mrp family chromosome partitioning ATPase
MFKRSHKTTDLRDTLSLRATDGTLQRTFDADVIESIRYMSTDLTLNLKLPRRVAIIAALRGEGVTHTALTLGLTLANDTGAKICVIELNWWAPGMISLLNPKINAVEARRKRPKKTEQRADDSNFAGYPGLSKVITGEIRLDEAIIRTNLPNLDLIPAGQMPADKRPSNARHASLRILIDQLSEQYDHLILDIPAVRTTSDSIALASLADACIVVAHQGATSTSSVQKALDDVKSLTMLGVVLNKVSISMPDWIRSLVPQE